MSPTPPVGSAPARDAAPLGRDRSLRAFLRDERVRFLSAGAFNSAFALGVFIALQLTLGRITHYLVVLLVTHVVGTLEAFLVYRRGVFKVRGSVLKDLIRFESVYLTALGVNVLALPVLVEVGGLPVITSQVLMVTVSAVLSYFGHKHFSFRRVH